MSWLNSRTSDEDTKGQIKEGEKSAFCRFFRAKDSMLDGGLFSCSFIRVLYIDKRERAFVAEAEPEGDARGISML